MDAATIHLSPGQRRVAYCSASAMLWWKGTPQSNGRTNRAGNRLPGAETKDWTSRTQKTQN